MHVAVLGAGIVGVITAYKLAARGHTVTVIDRQSSAAAETSFANGGQLSFSHAEPWANPYILPKVFKWMNKDDAPLVFRPSADPHMIRWGLMFLRNCTAARANRNSINALRLGLYSKQEMQKLQGDTGLEFDHLSKGILHIFTSEEDLNHAIEQSKFQAKFNCPMVPLDPAGCIELEPALAHAGKKIFGGIHATEDESGDANQFGNKLTQYCVDEMGVEFKFNTHVMKINTDGDKIVDIETNHGNIKADRYIMSLGSYSAIELRRIGIRAPIYPMKGYSLTYRASEFAPNVSITDQELKLVYSRLGNRLRVAGTAEFAGYDTTVKAKRIASLERAAETLFPQAAEAGLESQWACLRPSTPDGPPILGQCKYENLILNTGHGTLGWTLAAGSASLAADIVEGRPTEVSLDGLTLERFH